MQLRFYSTTDSRISSVTDPLVKLISGYCQFRAVRREKSVNSALPLDRVCAGFAPIEILRKPAIIIGTERRLPPRDLHVAVGTEALVTAFCFRRGVPCRTEALSADGKRTMRRPRMNGGLGTIGKIFTEFLRSMNTNANL